MSHDVNYFDEDSDFIEMSVISASRSKATIVRTWSVCPCWDLEKGTMFS